MVSPKTDRKSHYQPKNADCPVTGIDEKSNCVLSSRMSSREDRTYVCCPGSNNNVIVVSPSSSKKNEEDRKDKDSTKSNKKKKQLRINTKIRDKSSMNIFLTRDRITLKENPPKEKINNTIKIKASLSNSFSDYFDEDDEFDEFEESGSFGVIKLGYLDTTKLVAIKTIEYDQMVNKDMVIREVKSQMSIDHENIIRCYGCCLEKDNALVVLEYADKGNLAQYMQCHRNMKKEMKIRILLEVSQALEYLHNIKRIVYRDLKPENILLKGNDLGVKLCDFGESKMAQNISTTLCGTPSYIAPEQFDFSIKDEPYYIDIYAFGILIWEVWTQDTPYINMYREYARSLIRFLAAIHKDTIRPDLDHKKLKDCPKELMEIMTKCWERLPKDRPKSISEIVHVLKSL